MLLASSASTRCSVETCTRFAWEWFGNSAEAENLMKEAFLNVFRQADIRHGNATLAATSLYRFVMTALLMQFCKANRDTSLPTGTGLHGQNCSVVQRAPPASSASAIELWDFQRAVVQLPLDLRLVFVLRDVLGWGHSKVAEILEFSPYTSQSQLFKARFEIA